MPLTDATQVARDGTQHEISIPGGQQGPKEEHENIVGGLFENWSIDPCLGLVTYPGEACLEEILWVPRKKGAVSIDFISPLFDLRYLATGSVNYFLLL